MPQNTVQTIRAELEQMVPFLEEITGLPSRWNGEFYLVEDADFLGKKPFDCRIELNILLKDAELRWRTLIHELLHSLSTGYNQRDYNQFYGWECKQIFDVMR